MGLGVGGGGHAGEAGGYSGTGYIFEALDWRELLGLVGIVYILYIAVGH